MHILKHDELKEKIITLKYNNPQKENTQINKQKMQN